MDAVVPFLVDLTTNMYVLPGKEAAGAWAGLYLVGGAMYMIG